MSKTTNDKWVKSIAVLLGIAMTIGSFIWFLSEQSVQVGANTVGRTENCQHIVKNEKDIIRLDTTQSHITQSLSKIDKKLDAIGTKIDKLKQ